MSLTRSSATVRVGLKPGGNRSGAGKISSRRGYRSVLYVSWIVLSATCASRLTSASTGRAPARSPCQNHPCCHGLQGRKAESLVARGIRQSLSSV